MKKTLLFIVLIISFYSCSSDNDNNSTGYPSQPITVYQSRLFDTLRVYTSVNDSLYLGNFDFNGYDSIRIQMSFSLSSEGGAVSSIDYSLVSIGSEIELIRQNLQSGWYVMDGKFRAPSSGDCYFRNRSANLGTGFFLIIVSNFKISM